MKSKKFTYILFAAVLFVWGIIGYRIFNTMDNSDDQTQFLTADKKEPFNDFSKPLDTARLLANYRDPFGLVKPKDTTKPKPLTLIKNNPLPVKPAINWSFIHYAGFIKNPSTKKLLALVNINGKSVMLSEGEVADNVTLLKNLRDSIYISFNGKKKYLPIRSNTQ